jgi:mannosyl-3-phosphoglycerate phosphatase
MAAAEIARLTGLNVRDAEKSNRRLATEPIIWEDSAEKWNPFCGELHETGLRVVKGGRFHHIMGDTDKALAVSILIDAYSCFYDAAIHSIAVGDSENDLGMLNIASTAIVIPMVDGTRMQPANKERVIYANAPGSMGWGHAMEEALDNWLSAKEVRQ